MEQEYIRSAVGIDLGSKLICIGAAKSGGVEVICDETAKRETPFVVSLGNQERMMGQIAYSKIKRNHRNSVIFAHRVLGASLSDPHVALERKWFYSQICGGEGDDNRLRFKLLYNGKQQAFLPEQIVAMMFQKIKKLIRANQMNDKELVLSVPGFFTE